MSAKSQRTYTRARDGVILLAVAVNAAIGVWSHPEPFVERLAPLAALALAAAATAFLASHGGAGRVTRIAPCFVLAALLVLPAPGGLVVALAALLAGRGAGVAGPYARGSSSAAAVALAVAVAQRLPAPEPFPGPGSPEALLRLALLFAVVQTVSVLLGALLRPLGGEIPDRPQTRIAGLLLLESANVPLAWLLAADLERAAWLPAAVLALLILLVLASLIRLDRALADLRDSHLALSSRLGELDTLHEIGREIVSSIEPQRVFAILERECRKIFPVDGCFVALVERASRTLLPVYRHARDQRAVTGGPAVRDGIARWVLEEKRPRRVDDLRRVPSDSPVHGDLVDPQARSVMAVPLIVEDRVIGVLGVQSGRPRAYDDHRLSVLTTIAQQAAVAIENARHYQMATVDSLTGFFLRDHFFQRLAEEDRRARRYGGRYSLLMVDLDGFKGINDANGHLAGDRYLSQVAATIREQLRGADLACRYGGDEFCLLLPETDLDGARVIAERIRSAVSDRIVGIDGLALRTTVSIGVAAFPENDAADLQALIGNADQALYRAKRGGRDRVVPSAA